MYSKAKQMDMTQVLELAEAEGWGVAFYYYTKAQIEQGKTVLEDERMADWRYLLPAQTGNTVLTLGAGWGTIPVALAENATAVHVVDRSPETIAFLRIRQRQQNLHQLHLIHADSWSHLNFERDAFDLIAVREFDWNGGHPMPFGEMLRRLYPLLKPGGTIQVTVGNRLAFQQLLGLERKHRSSPLHTLPGYRRILRTAQFTDIQVYAPLPHHQGIPMFYVPLDDTRAMQFFFSHLFPLFERVSAEARQAYRLQYAIARTMVRFSLMTRLTRLAPYFVPGFCIFARKAI